MENQLKATELRIGNYLFDRNNRLCQVKELGESITAPAIKGARTSLPNKPIQLTEDILLRLGFEKGFHRYGLENCGLKCHKSLKENYWIVSQGFGMQFTELTEIQYIHQLQNLFFSLCGEELTFKN